MFSTIRNNANKGDRLNCEPKNAKRPESETVKVSNRVERLTLPVDQVRVGDHPGFQHTSELDVALRRRQQLIVLMTAGDVHLDL